MSARERAISAEVSKHFSSKGNAYQRGNLNSCFEAKFAEAFGQKKYARPSEFFLAEMPWIFGLVVYDRYKEAFLYMVDHITDYPYSINWSRRSFRSDNYLHYMNRIGRVLSHLGSAGNLDADVADILIGNIPEHARSFFKHKNYW